MSAPSKKQLASRHVQRLRTMRKQLLEMSLQWEDLDQFCVNELESLAETVEVTAAGLLDDEAAKDMS